MLKIRCSKKQDIGVLEVWLMQVLKNHKLTIGVTKILVTQIGL